MDYLIKEKDEAMSVNELEIIAGFLERAICPEDVFGIVSGERDLKVAHRKLAKALHPDMYNGNPEAETKAKTLFQLLEEIHSEALEKLAKKTYGDRTPLSNKIPIIIKSKYTCENKLNRSGDIADIFIASLESSKIKQDLIVKIARSAEDNDLLIVERDVLKDLQDRWQSDTWKSCIPIVVDSFLLDEGKAKKRRVNIEKRFDGFLTCEEIHNYFGDGKIDGRTLAWMWKRMIIMIEWVWSLGYVHGAILPTHIMFYPDNDGGNARDIRKHSIRLIDWCYAVKYKERTRLSAFVPQWKDLYAPEIINKESLGPWTDLYMGAQVMLYLQGKSPENVPIQISKSWESCIIKETKKRPQSISKYFEEFDILLRKVYGAPKYYEFIVPGLRVR